MSCPATPKGGVWRSPSSRRFDVEAELEAAGSGLVFDRQHVLAGCEAPHHEQTGALQAVLGDQLETLRPSLPDLHRDAALVGSRKAQRDPDALGAVRLEGQLGR